MKVGVQLLPAPGSDNPVPTFLVRVTHVEPGTRFTIHLYAATDRPPKRSVPAVSARLDHPGNDQPGQAESNPDIAMFATMDLVAGTYDPTRQLTPLSSQHGPVQTPAQHLPADPHIQIRLPRAELQTPNSAYPLRVGTPGAEHPELRTWHIQARYMDRGRELARSEWVPIIHQPEQPGVPTVPDRWWRYLFDGYSREATYECHPGNAARFYADAAEDAEGTRGFFPDLAEAIEAAEDFIFICAWKFHPWVRLRRGDGFDGTIGKLLIEQAKRNPDMVVAIHLWDQTAAPDSDWAGDYLLKINHGEALPDNLFLKVSWHLHWLKWDSSLVSTHQKFAVMDGPEPQTGRRDLVAFYGGFDLAGGRFDYGGHPFGPHGTTPAEESFLDDLERSLVSGFVFETNEWHNSEFPLDRSSTERLTPRMPWHDIQTRIQGPAGWDITREFVGRWMAITKRIEMGDPERAQAAVHDIFETIIDRAQRPELISQAEQPRPEAAYPWVAQVVRSTQEDEWAHSDGGPSDAYLEWRLRDSSEASVHAAYLDAIGRAENFIYIENQYFRSSGHLWPGKFDTLRNLIAKALVDRIREQREHGDFHVYVVMPQWPASGAAGTATRPQRLLTWKTMEYIATELGEHWRESISFYFLMKSYGSKDGRVHTHRDGAPLSRLSRILLNRRYMIYLHSKIMIVDDKVFINGSANIAERSMSGDRDAELCVMMWPCAGAVGQRAVDQLRAYRLRLWREHLGESFDVAGMDGRPGSATVSRAVQAQARANYHAMRLAKPVDGHLMALPLVLRREAEAHTLRLTPTPGALRLRVEPPPGEDYAEGYDVFPDAPLQKMEAYRATLDPEDERLQWRWWCVGEWLPHLPTWHFFE